MDTLIEDIVNKGINKLRKHIGNEENGMGWVRLGHGKIIIRLK